MGSIITAADIAAYAPELDLSSYNPVTLSGMCAAATQRAQKFCQVDGFEFTSVVNETDRARISNSGDLVISTRRRPIFSVSAISLVKGGFTTTLTLSDPTTGQLLYQIPNPSNKLVFPNSYLYMTGTFLAGGSSQLLTLRGADVFYQISYQAGYQTIPDDLRYAAVLYFRDIYSNKAISPTTGAPLSGFTQGSYSENYDTSSRPNGKSDYVVQAESILMNGNYARMEF